MVCLFCYANVYSGIISVDNGLILSVFYKILGTNRSPYVLALPFLMIGAYIEKYKLYKNGGIQKIVFAIAFFLLWCVEVVFINLKTGNYNIYMTIIGALAVCCIYALLRKSVNNIEGYTISNKIFVFYICLFGVQYSMNRSVVYLLNLNSIENYLLWLTFYCGVTSVVIILFHKVGDKNDRKFIE